VDDAAFGDQVHEAALAGQHADGPAARHGLAEYGEVGHDSVMTLGPGEPQPESRDDLVED